METVIADSQHSSADEEGSAVMRLQQRSEDRLDSRPVPLEPFGHQVAGQSSMLMLDPMTVCKPLITREHHLYLTLPSLLQPFTPRYHGVLYVRLEEGDDGSLNLWGYYPDTQGDQEVDNSNIVRGSLQREDIQDNSQPVDNIKSTRDPLPSREDPQDEQEGSSKFSGRHPLRVPAIVTDSSSKVTRSPIHREDVEGSDVDDHCQVSRAHLHTGVDNKKQAVDNGQINRDNRQHRNVHDSESTLEMGEAGRGADQRVDVAEDEHFLLPVQSEFSSGTSTPMSSGSELDIPSAVDHSSFPSRPSSGCVVRLTQDGEYELMAGRAADNKFLITTNDHALPQDSTGPNSVKEPTTQPLNPWGFSLHTRLLDKMRKSQPSPSGCPFLVLENVVARFVRPCILDLKVGSRLHGDDASPKKMASQSHKCNITTSRSLGLRLCGMQVYEETTRAYKNMDKYHGRTLTEETFYHVLRDFLHNGREFRSELLAPILHRLHALMDCLNQLHSFRFYASSLLIMYDGQRPDSVRLSDGEMNSESTGVPNSVVENDFSEINRPHRDKKIKGAHALDSKYRQGKDVDSGKQGLQLAPCFKGKSSNSDAQPSLSTRQQSRQPDNAVQPSLASDRSSSTDTLVAGGASYNHDPDGMGSLSDSTGTVSLSDATLVDVRMIDFAHTTHSGFHDNVVHEGPDRDYIWGLENLTRMFSQLQRDYC